MQVAKWGNSLAVRLPKSVVDALDLKDGDDILLHLVGSRAIEVEKTPDRLELLERLRKYEGLMPKDFRCDREEANSRE